MASPQPLTPQELAIMKVVWRLGTATVRDVHDALRKAHRDDLAYTTTLTMMRILEQKGVLAKEADADSRAHRYRPVRSQRQMMRVMVREFVDRVFDGAADSLVAHLVADRRLSTQDRSEIRRLLDDKYDTEE
ncbi:MAG TPA: BlaI/MecI/CopY family transcriptional regulator [Luteitalea sp.]|nr:BlaI/MecI/CopY family transcriptional regulator [Luteitalea sp.]